MNKSEKSAAESYLESLKSSGLMNEKNEAEILAVAEMLKHPLSLEQAREQIKQHHAGASRPAKKESKR